MSGAVRRVPLARGVEPDAVLQKLRARLSELGNIASATPVRPGSPFPEVDLRDAYVMCVEGLEQDLLWASADPAIVEHLHTERYWRIRELYSGSTRPARLIDDEARRQVAHLAALVDDLQTRSDRAGQGGGYGLVVDTNILLHCLLPDQIPWPTVTSRTTVRLIVPLRVVEELDAKKCLGNAKLRSRARALLPWLEQAVGSGGEPKQLRGSVTSEVPVDGALRHRPADADEEILTTCTEFTQLTGHDVGVVTGDTGMRLRAGAQGTTAPAFPTSTSA